MKKLLVVGIALVSLAAQAGTGSLTCEIRVAKGADAAASKTFNVDELTGVSIPDLAKKIQIGTVNDVLVEISLKGHYAGKAILGLSAKSANSSTSGLVFETIGMPENVLGFTIEGENQYFSVLCRESIAE
jgi:hypothetical protein